MMLRPNPSLLLLLALLVGPALPAPAAAEEPKGTVVITGSDAQRYRVALQRFADRSPAQNAARSPAFRDAIADALEFSGVFDRVDEKAFLGPEETVALEGGPPVICSDWTQIGADALVEGELKQDAQSLSAAFRVWDTTRCRELLRRRYSQSAATDPKTIARRIADDIVEAFTGMPGVSSTEIAFVSDRTGNKEIYVMNADGSGVRAATANRSINNFPGWSADGDAIVYTSYRHQRQPLLFLSSRGRRRPGRLLSNDLRPQYRGVFDPSGKWLALVISTGGAPEIYLSRDDGSGLRRLTSSRAIEVSPSFSPDGSRLAYVSDKTGSPQIYVMNRDGSGERRLTYNGSYNTNPAWSPDGEWIAYETRVGGQFDIWLIDPEGSVNVPLISHPRSDEAPAWAPNSRMLVFSSTRRGRADLYVVDRDGSNLRRLTSSAGDNTSPAWGPLPQ